MNFKEALSYLLSLGHETLAIKLGLENTERLLNALGNPQKSFPAVQIAGTNGKGSTAFALDTICRAAGIRTGLFTSPHLVSVTERIGVSGEQISEPDFARLATQVKQTAEELVERGVLETLPTFFEQVTAIALLALRETHVELAILETGLGGRLDSTTAAGADIVALTPIAMDHEEYLGHSLAEIAAEKAAIVRPGVKAIVGPQPAEALAVVLNRCKESGVLPTLIDQGPDNSEPSALQAAPARHGERFRAHSQTILQTSEDGRFCVTFETSQDKYERVWLGLRGRHQVTNAAVAIALAESLRDRGFSISHDAICAGLETAQHPARLELVAGNPPVLLDGAHNPAGARALRDYLDEFVKQPVTMIFGAMRDKRLDEMARALFPAADRLILTGFDNPRAATPEALRLAVPTEVCDHKIQLACSPSDAWRMASAATPPLGLICVTGSLYLIGEFKSLRARPT